MVLLYLLELRKERLTHHDRTGRQGCHFTHRTCDNRLRGRHQSDQCMPWRTTQTQFPSLSSEARMHKKLGDAVREIWTNKLNAQQAAAGVLQRTRREAPLF